MRFAKLIKIGGELIEAAKADYKDYKGFLRCPECGEPVFLRKHHRRGTVEIPDAFIHHKLSESTALCEARVNSYKTEKIKAIASKARGQRLKKLEISLWKYLKTNLCLDLRNWSKFVKEVKDDEVLSGIVNYGEEILKILGEFMLSNTLPKLSGLMLEKNRKHIEIAPEHEKIIMKFLDSHQRDWNIHEKITGEALELFLSKSIKKIRYRLLCCLCYPGILIRVPEFNLLELEMNSEEWQSNFRSYLTLQITFIFLTVDWLEIFR